MENKRQHILKWKTKLSTPFIIVTVAGMLLFTLMFSFLVANMMSDQLISTQGAKSLWRISFLIFLAIQLLANITLLIIMFMVLHRTIGAFPRIENNLEKVLAGDYAIRIGLRKKDNEHVTGLVTKLNKVLELLESKAKQR
jgi:glucan phosphoethanolaminetransferase (alkaline phosphatase superfamily)